MNDTKAAIKDKTADSLYTISDKAAKLADKVNG